MARLMIALLLLGSVLRASSSPVLYEGLALPLQENARAIDRLCTVSALSEQHDLMKRFVEEVDGTLSVGRELSKNSRIDEALVQAYLKELRRLSHTKEMIDASYRQALRSAIARSDIQSFEALVSNPLEIIHHPRVRGEIIAFYQKNFPRHSLQNVDALCNEQDLETKSLQIAIEQEQAYEEHLRILKRSEAAKLKKGARIGSRNSVLLSADADGSGGYEFEAENLNPYTVTMSIDFESLNNLQPSAKLPLFIEIPGKTRKKVLQLKRISSALGSDYRSSYGWVRGSAFAVHQDDYLYRLPFTRGAAVSVSQGYHGETSHKGLSAYAVDFPVPIGTPVYAAREGMVVGSEGSNNLGAPSPEYRQYANYVIIEHSDGTMGNYYHLKQGGTAVSIGQKVKKGDLIGYSGNTGYTSGPHLHFSVSKVDPVSMRRPMNLPIKMQTLEGIVSLPRKGDRYTVQ